MDGGETSTRVKHPVPRALFGGGLALGVCGVVAVFLPWLGAVGLLTLVPLSAVLAALSTPQVCVRCGARASSGAAQCPGCHRRFIEMPTSLGPTLGWGSESSEEAPEAPDDRDTFHH